MKKEDKLSAIREGFISTLSEFLCSYKLKDSPVSVVSGKHEYQLDLYGDKAKLIEAVKILLEIHDLETAQIELASAASLVAKEGSK